jgi:hypothetical protein
MHDDLPEFALSVRQPWAWAIIHGGKDIENRNYAPLCMAARKAGRLAIHAALGMSPAEYDDAQRYMRERNIGAGLPPFDALVRGYIIGSVDVIGCITKSNRDAHEWHRNPWYQGNYGIVLANPQPCKPIPVKGQLGIYRWQVNTDPAPPPKTWASALAGEHG